jgi:hypothetical protein
MNELKTTCWGNMMIMNLGKLMLGIATGKACRFGSLSFALINEANRNRGQFATAIIGINPNAKTSNAVNTQEK